jgi:uncharacterized membrane protein
MRHVWSIMLKGLAALLPVGLTFYFIYWLSISIERVLRPVLVSVLAEKYYLPGMGLIAGLVVLYFLGLTVNAWIVKRLFRVGEGLLERIPLIKSIYGSLHDFMEYFSSIDERRGMKQVVLVSIADARLIGFVTGEQVGDVPFPESPDEEIVAVYLPLSYQIGGYTIFLPRSHVEPVDISMEDAMRRVLTAGLSKPGAENTD